MEVRMIGGGGCKSTTPASAKYHPYCSSYAPSECSSALSRAKGARLLRALLSSLLESI